MPTNSAGHVGTATFFDASQHITAGGSYRKHVGERGWGIEPEYAFMTDGSHQDHLLTLNVVKDFTRPAQTVVSGAVGRRCRGTIVRAGWKIRYSATSPSSAMPFAPGVQLGRGVRPSSAARS